MSSTLEKFKRRYGWKYNSLYDAALAADFAEMEKIKNWVQPSSCPKYIIDNFCVYNHSIFNAGLRSLNIEVVKYAFNFIPMTFVELNYVLSFDSRRYSENIEAVSAFANTFFDWYTTLGVNFEPNNLIQCMWQIDSFVIYAFKPYVDQNFTFFKKMLSKTEVSTEVWQEACSIEDTRFLEELLKMDATLWKRIKTLDSSCILIFAPKTTTKKNLGLFEKLCCYATSKMKPIYRQWYDGVHNISIDQKTRRSGFGLGNMPLGLYGSVEAMLCITNMPERYFVRNVVISQPEGTGELCTHPKLAMLLHQGTLENFVKLKNKEGIKLVLEMTKTWPTMKPTITEEIIETAKQEGGNVFAKWVRGLASSQDEQVESSKTLKENLNE